jgi:ferredoxin-NADP reductase
MAGQEQKDLTKIVEIVRENNDISSIYLEKPNHGFDARKAGQFMTVKVLREGAWSEPHPFTISCPPEDKLLRLTIKREGAFTTALHMMPPGTDLKCIGPLGKFCRDVDEKPSIVMIAGGVGITPFFSVISHFKNIGAGNRVKLFWVNKSAGDIIFADDMKEISGALNLTIIHNLSREENAGRFYDPGYSNVVYETGRLTADVLKKYGVSKTDAFYLCGPPPMMESALRDLAALGIQPDAVQKENFSWKV